MNDTSARRPRRWPPRSRSWWWVAIVPAAILVLALPGRWWPAHQARPKADTGAVVTVDASSPVIVLPGPTPTPEDRLTPPHAPSLPGAVAAAPDAFVGDWRTADGQRLAITPQGRDRYSVTLGDERYDGILRDGRIHFPRGIDGEWLQAIGDTPCLYLGSGQRFCHR